MGSESACSVEGDWNSFEIRLVREEDTPKLLAHLRTNFYRDEPLSNYLGYDDLLAADYDTCVIGALKDNMSLIAIDKSTGEVSLTQNILHLKFTQLQNYSQQSNYI
jgi:hypothetical protein